MSQWYFHIAIGCTFLLCHSVLLMKYWDEGQHCPIGSLKYCPVVQFQSCPVDFPGMSEIPLSNYCNPRGTAQIYKCMVHFRDMLLCFWCWWPRRKHVRCRWGWICLCEECGSRDENVTILNGKFLNLSCALNEYCCDNDVIVATEQTSTLNLTQYATEEVSENTMTGGSTTVAVTDSTTLSVTGEEETVTTTDTTYFTSSEVQNTGITDEAGHANDSSSSDLMTETRNADTSMYESTVIANETTKLLSTLTVEENLTTFTNETAVTSSVSSDSSGDGVSTDVTPCSTACRHPNDSEAKCCSTTDQTTTEEDVETEVWCTMEKEEVFSNGVCRRSECFFDGHCYFIHDILQGVGEDVCPVIIPGSLELAVETLQEMNFISRLLLSTKHLTGSVLTSGIRLCHTDDVWKRWNKTMDVRMLIAEDETTTLPCLRAHQYIIVVMKELDAVQWGLWNSSSSSPSHVICERRASVSSSTPVTPPCATMCMAVDQYGGRWETCSGTRATSRCPLGAEGVAQWECGMDGKFVGDNPDFKECRHGWIEDAQNSVADQQCANQVLDSVHNHTARHAFFGHEIGPLLSVMEGVLQLHILQVSQNIGKPIEESLNASVAFTEHATMVVDDMLNASLPWEQLYQSERAPLGDRLGQLSESLGYALVDLAARLKAGSLYSALFRQRHMVLFGVQLLDTSDRDIKFPEEAKAPSYIDIDVRAASPDKRPRSVGFLLAHRPASMLFPGALNSLAGMWDGDGCSVAYSDEVSTLCECSHLSTFAVLMDMHSYAGKDLTLEILTWACSGASVLCLLVTLSVLHGCRSLEGERTSIGKHLCLCLFLGHTATLGFMDRAYIPFSDAVCSVVSAFLHYIFLASFMWMTAEGHHLYRHVISVFTSGQDLRPRYLLCCYGVPALIVAITQLTASLRGDRAYGREELCWLTAPVYIWSFMGPVVTLTAWNTVVLFLALRAAVCAGISQERPRRKKLGIWIKGWFSLSVLLGVTWLFGLTFMEENDGFVYLFVILNGSQGVFIFLTRCVLNRQVLTAVLTEARHRLRLPSSFSGPASRRSSAVPTEQMTQKTRRASGDSGRGESLGEDVYVKRTDTRPALWTSYESQRHLPSGLMIHCPRLDEENDHDC